VVIDPSVVSKDDVEMLQDMIVAAVNDASARSTNSWGSSMSGADGWSEASGARIARPLSGSRLSRCCPNPSRDSSSNSSACRHRGEEAAQRLAFHVLRNPREDADRLCDAIRDVKERVTYCSVCNNITDTDPVSLLQRRPRQPADLRRGRAAET
jgi:hypothetical protein